MNFLKAATVLCVACLMVVPATAGLVYTYTGNDFTGVTGAYNTSDNLIVSFTTTTAIPGNLSLQGYTVGSITAASFSDGVNAVDLLAAYSSGSTFQGAFDGGAHTFGLGLATDANGNIINWNMGFNVIDPSNHAIHIYSNNSNLWIVIDLASQGDQNSQNWNGYTPFPANEARIFSGPGTWTVTQSTPEPASLWLLSSGLVLLVGLDSCRRGKKLTPVPDWFTGGTN